jgi:hypothetical protein
MRKTIQRTLAASLLTMCLGVSAQERGIWRAASTTAKSITGDIALSDEKISIDFFTFTMSRIRALTPAETSAAFDADPAAQRTPGAAGSLYRLSIPAAQKFLHKNTLCGTDETQWMATYASGRSLQLAFFSDPTPPVLTLDALANSTTLCGTFSYVK